MLAALFLIRYPLPVPATRTRFPIPVTRSGQRATGNAYG
jgi:hypothetical protein